MEDMQAVINEMIEQRSLINNVSKTYLFLKRFIDIVVSIIAVLLLLPLFLILALWIKVRKMGAVLHIEDKYGLRGKRFKAYELSRTMKSIYLIKLPLLFNVFKGNMSLVGPQPTPTENLSHDPWYNLRMSAKPGFTGMWQVSGKVGGFDEMVRVDLKYIRERSLLNDFKILLKATYLAFKKKKPLNKAI